MLLNNIGAGQSGAAALQKKQKRLLDELKDDLKSLSLRINSNERVRVEEMAKAFDDATRDLGLLGRVDVGGVCQQPKTFVSPTGADTFAQVLKLQLDHVKLAFACGLTQVAVMTLSEVPHDTYPWIDQSGKTKTGKPCPTEDFHQCVAHYNNDTERRLCFEGSVRYQLEHIVNFAQGLDQIKEANGKTMLENTLIVITGEVGDGSHEVRQKPHILIGGRGALGLRTGRYLKIPTMSGTLAKAGDAGSIDGDVTLNGAYSARTEADLLRDIRIHGRSTQYLWCALPQPWAHRPQLNFLFLGVTQLATKKADIQSRAYAIRPHNGLMFRQIVTNCVIPIFCLVMVSSFLLQCSVQNTCTSGNQSLCVCPDKQQGMRNCREDGVYGPCVCPSPRSETNHRTHRRRTLFLRTPSLRGLCPG